MCYLKLDLASTDPHSACAQVGETVPTAYRVKFLPPLSVRFILPHDYPSASPPFISLEAPWLSKEQVTQLLDRLLAEAEADLSFPVCYTLVSWLESSALEYLGIGGALVIPEDSNGGEYCASTQLVTWWDGSRSDSGAVTCADTGRLASSSTSRAVPTADSRRPEQVIDMLVRFNANQERRIFQVSTRRWACWLLGLHKASRSCGLLQEGTWTCKICFEEVPGIRCIRAANCPHYFCASCLQSHCKTQLKENRVDLLLCPDPQCKEPFIRDVRLIELLVRGLRAAGLTTLNPKP